MVYWFLSWTSRAFIIFHFNYTRRVIWRLASHFSFFLSTSFTGKWSSKRFVRSTKQFKKTSSFPHLLLFAAIFYRSQMGWMIRCFPLHWHILFRSHHWHIQSENLVQHKYLFFNQTSITFNKIPVNAKKNLTCNWKMSQLQVPYRVIIYERLLHSSNMSQTRMVGAVKKRTANQSKTEQQKKNQEVRLKEDVFLRKSHLPAQNIDLKVNLFIHHGDVVSYNKSLLEFTHSH